MSVHSLNVILILSVSTRMEVINASAIQVRYSNTKQIDLIELNLINTIITSYAIGKRLDN